MVDQRLLDLDEFTSLLDLSLTSDKTSKAKGKVTLKGCAVLPLDHLLVW